MPRGGDLAAFLRGEIPQPPEFPAASVFSGAGIGDWGFRTGGGFRFVAHVELSEQRAAVIRLNFPESRVVVGRLEDLFDEFVEAASREGQLALLTVTPPCAGFSSAAQWKAGSVLSQKPSWDARDRLALAAAEAICRLAPLTVFLENVPGFRTRKVVDPRTGNAVTPLDGFLRRLPEYDAFVDVVRMADHGVPQRRERFVAVLARRDALDGLSASDVLPPRTHSRDGSGGTRRWPAARQTLASYRPLDARSPETARDPEDPLHVVPTYTPMQYSWVSRIPPDSGRNAYENARCDRCGRRKAPKGRATCDRCGAVLRGRPRIYENGRVRLIKGQGTSYRRMPSNLPVPTITTNNGQYGGDSKIHPWQNRVLSVREVLDHQTVPRDFRWHADGERPKMSIIRECVGESVPPWFTFRLGMRLYLLLRGRAPTPAVTASPASKKS